MHKKLIFIFLLAIILSLPWQVHAEDDDARRSHTVTLYIENDVLGDKEDRYYTHGTKLSWVSPDLSDYRDNPFIPIWSYPLVEKLPFVNRPGDQRSVSLSFGQNIYTPADIERKDLVKNDRPYAGISYLAFGLHSKNAWKMDTLEFDIGIVGPHSYAEDCQKIFHKWIDAADPKGWKYQLHDEPIFNISFERKWRLLQTKYANGLGFDFIPHIGVSIGNAYTATNAGAEIRFGWNLPNDFGTFVIRPGSDSSAALDRNDPRFFHLFRCFGLHLFFAVDGSAVARNIFLDGNTFQNSHSVDKKHFYADIAGGVGVILNRFKITYSYVLRTKEFETQGEEQRFGAITISYSL